MKLSKRLLSVLLVCLSLFALFLTQVHASDSDVPPLYFRSNVYDVNFNKLFTDNGEVFPVGYIVKFTRPGGSITYTYPQYLGIEYGTSPDGIEVINDIIINKGDGFSYTLGGVLDSLVYVDANDNQVARRDRKSFNNDIFVLVYSNTGASRLITPTVTSRAMNNGRFNFTIEVSDVPFDVYYFKVLIYDSSPPYGGSAPSSYHTWFRRVQFDDLSHHSFYIIDEEKGLLKTIIETITFGFDDLADKIYNLPNLIIDGIKNVLLSLVVPSDEFLDYFWMNFNDICGLKFGILWDMPSFIFTNAQNIVDVLLADEVQTTIEIPEVLIPLSNGVYLNFGGWEVDLYYPKFSVVYDAIWLISGGIGTFLFIKGVRKRYEDVFGG